MNEMLQVILVCVIFGLVGYAMALLFSAIRVKYEVVEKIFIQKYGKEKYEEFKKEGLDIVNHVEETISKYEDSMGIKRHELAKQYLNTVLERLNIKMSDEMLDTAIQIFVIFAGLSSKSNQIKP